MLLVVPIVNIAVRVIVLRLVERNYGAEIISYWTYVIGYDINHHPNAFGVCSAYKILETLLASKVRVNLCPVSGPVSMEAIWCVVYYWRYPNCVETEVSDIV